MVEHTETKPWLLRKIVLPQHTDHAGVMWHGTYLNWLEEARINALASVGLDYKDMSDQGFEMPVIELEIKYFSPILHGDNVLLKSWVTRGKGPRWKFKTNFFKNTDKSAASANVCLVLVKKDNFAVLRNGPEHISKALGSMQKGPR